MKYLLILLIVIGFVEKSYAQAELLKNIALGIESSTQGEFITGTINIKTVPGIELNGSYFFALNRFDDYDTGYSLWKTDGTAENTINIKSYGTSNNGNVFNNLFIEQSILLNGYFYFKEGPLGGNNTSKIWRSNGTEAGTEIVVTESNPQSSEMILLNNNIIYTDFTTTYGRELYTIPNGMPVTSPQVLKDIRPGDNGGQNPIGLSSDAEQLNVLGNSIIFVADDGTTGDELWITDGTESGTQLLKDIRPNGSSNPTAFISFNNKLYFFAYDGTSNGFWETDGTTEGTKLIKEDLFSNEDYLGIVYNNKMYFGASQLISNNFGVEIWSSDGTTSGTLQLKDINLDTESSKPHSFTIANNLLFFVAETSATGQELWVTDGSETNTFALTDFLNVVPFSNIFPFSGNRQKLFSDGDRIYYLANFSTTNISNNEIGISEGTMQSTSKLTEINPNGSTIFTNPFILNDQLIFEAFEENFGVELWTLEFETLSVNDFGATTKSSITLYPNPSSDMISLKDVYSVQQVDIYSIDGRKMKTFTSNFNAMSITDLQVGLYVAMIKNTNNRQSVIKFLKS